MFPTLYTQQTPFGELPYNTWGLMITLAFLAASVYAHGRAKRVGIDPDKMVGMYITAIVTGLMGARLMHFTMATPDVFFADPMIFFKIWTGGFAFYGGFILAALAGIVYARLRGIDAWKLADVVAPAVMLGLSMGRIGCFSAGCCHGRAIELPVDAVPLFPTGFGGGQLWFFPHMPFLAEMTRHGVGHNNVVVYPTQLFEVVAAFTIYLVGRWLFEHRRFDGMVMAFVCIAYAVWRPFNESLRGDEVRGTDYFGFLTSSQLISIPVFAVGLLIILVKFRSGVKPEQPFEISEEDELAGSAPRI
jgi:phosphatidylglycerol:prolipoprotein diacylglycerol transferase